MTKIQRLSVQATEHAKEDFTTLSLTQFYEYYPYSMYWAAHLLCIWNCSQKLQTLVLRACPIIDHLGELDPIGFLCVFSLVGQVWISPVDNRGDVVQAISCLFCHLHSNNPSSVSWWDTCFQRRPLQWEIFLLYSFYNEVPKNHELVKALWMQVGATLIGVHYYLNAWHPAMMEEPPLLGFKYYAFYMYCFFMYVFQRPSHVQSFRWSWYNITDLQANTLIYLQLDLKELHVLMRDRWNVSCLDVIDFMS